MRLVGNLPHATLALILVAITYPLSLSAATLWVGPGGIKTISEAARVARDGDAVEIAAGTYRGDTAVWSQKRLTIRAVGGQAELIADGKSAEDKAIWVIRDGDFVIDSITFRGARVADGNGAGIRFEKGRLTIRNCLFDDNESGIVAANFENSELFIEDSIFSHAPHIERPLKHLLYVGSIARLSVRGSRFHSGFFAHLIKSRARVTELRYNLIWDGAGGTASYEVDLPNGGDVTLLGNIIGKSDTPSNPVVVAYGAEGGKWPLNRLRLSHNTFVNEGWMPVVFLRIWSEHLNLPIELASFNNLEVGLGLMLVGRSGIQVGNRPAVPWVLRDPETLEFSLRHGDWIWGAITPRPPDELIPAAEFTLPIGIRPLEPTAHLLPGAIQSAIMPSRPPHYSR